MRACKSLVFSSAAWSQQNVVPPFPPKVYLASTLMPYWTAFFSLQAPQRCLFSQDCEILSCKGLISTVKRPLGLTRVKVSSPQSVSVCLCLPFLFSSPTHTHISLLHYSMSNLVKPRPSTCRPHLESYT